MHARERKERLAAAMRCLKSGIWFRTEANCRAILKEHAGDVEALLLMGLGVAAGGETARAAALLDQVARERPEFDHPCQDFAALQPAVPPETVTELYRACVGLSPGNIRLRRAFAERLIDQGQMMTSPAAASRRF